MKAEMSKMEIRDALHGAENDPVWLAALALVAALREEKIEEVQMAKGEELQKAAGALDCIDEVRDELKEQMRTANVPEKEEEKEEDDEC